MNIDNLIKILELEKSRGYIDKAVSGGLDKFLARLSSADYESLPPPSPSYRALDKIQRAEWVVSTLKRFHATKSPIPARSAQKPALTLDSPITSIKGINLKLSARFGKLGVNTVRDLIYFFPRRHIDYSKRSRIAELEIGVEQTVVARVWKATERRSRRRMRSTEAIVGDETGTIRAIWFNQPYLAKRLSTNTQIALSGRVEVFKGQKVFQSPEYEFVESADLIHTGRIVPVYPLTSGMYPRQVRKVVKDALDSCLPKLEDFLPEMVRTRAGFMELKEAIRQVHYPESETSKDMARRRLAFDELFLIQLGVLARKRNWQEGAEGILMDTEPGILKGFLTSLPFELTPAQRRVLDEIRSDVTRGKPMSRLLQGDVGSGKTVVAAAAMLIATAGGCQAALMAPTEILAEQHFENICRLMGDQSGEGIVRALPSLTIGLLTGGVRTKAKRELNQRIAAGEVDILIGTQALIQKKVEFHRLGIAVVDEQHRFGVMQRHELRHKGTSPHVLVMSATPIPRTLALTFYGDLDISLIDELPPGRRQIKTRWLSPRQRQSGYNFVRKQVSEGRQAFVICPLVEESESIEARAATSEYERLSRDVFTDLKLGLLHGRMSSVEKDEVMQQFRAGELDILVSTSVVEVGVDVPNATVILVEGSERFGLSQLHQFRGRVWRSSHQSYCLLLSENPTADGRERLSIMERTHNGFILAEEDLKMRGPGDFFGTRQSGLPDLKMARLSDVQLLELAREEAMHLFEIDPDLQEPEHRALGMEVSRLWKGAD